MATIVNSTKYGEGHEVVFKSKLAGTRLAEIGKLGYAPESDVFGITLKQLSIIDKTWDLFNGKDSITFIDKNNRSFRIIGKAETINDMFNHFTKNAKSLTGVLTEIKELYSLEVFRAYNDKGIVLSEDEVIELVQKQQPATKANVASVYYTSAVAQLEEFKKHVPRGNYVFERQSKNLTKKLYDRARKLTAKSNDNWNPADVWVIHKSFDMTPLYEAKTASELNQLIGEAFQKKDLIPISLKQVQTNKKADSHIIDPARLLKQKVDLDFGFDKVDVTKTFNNLTIFTKCGYCVRAGFKGSGGSINVSLEGSFKSANYQLGAIDAKVYKTIMREEHSYTTRSSFVQKADYDKAKQELKAVIKKYPRFSVTMKSYEEAVQIFESGDKLLKDRFANLISYLYALLILPKDFEDHMKTTYLLAKKITRDSSVYLLISE